MMKLVLVSLLEGDLKLSKLWLHQIPLLLSINLPVFFMTTNKQDKYMFVVDRLAISGQKLDVFLVQAPKFLNYGKYDQLYLVLQYPLSQKGFDNGADGAILNVLSIDHRKTIIEKEVCTT